MRIDYIVMPFIPKCKMIQYLRF